MVGFSLFEIGLINTIWNAHHARTEIMFSRLRSAMRYGQSLCHSTRMKERIFLSRPAKVLDTPSRHPRLLGFECLFAHCRCTPLTDGSTAAFYLETAIFSGTPRT